MAKYLAHANVLAVTFIVFSVSFLSGNMQVCVEFILSLELSFHLPFNTYSMYELPQRFQVTDLHVAYFNLSFALCVTGSLDK